MAQPDLSICIPTYNRAALLADTLKHLEFLNDFPLTTEVVVCDNASPDDTQAVVQAAAARLPNLRYYRQETNVGPMGNIGSVFRMANGRYATYLADDDRFVPEALAEVIGYFEENPEVVATYHNWFDWDLENDKPLAEWNRFREIQTFDKSSFLDLYNQVVSKRMMPEIGVFRTSVMHRILYLPRRIWFYNWWMCKFVEHGTIAFHPSTFYRMTAVLDTGEAHTRWGGDLALNNVDQFRGGVEMVLFDALKQQGKLPVPESVRPTALQGINAFAAGRAHVASRVASNRHDYIAAIEMMTRFCLWEPLDEEARAAVRKSLVPLAAAQATIETYEQVSGVTELVVCQSKNAENVVAALRAARDDVAVTVRTEDEILARKDALDTLVVVEDTALRDRLVAAGLHTGHVIAFMEVCACFHF